MRIAALMLCCLVLSGTPAVAGVIRGAVRVPTGLHEEPSFQPYAGRASSMPGHARASRGAVTDAVLSIQSLPAGVDSMLPLPAERASLAQRDESFVPRVVAIAAGSSVDFPNFDPIYHIVFSVSPARRFDLGKYPRGQSRTVRFTRTGLVNVFCDIHADMAAFIIVLPNRAFTRPDANGNYRLPELPAGRYLLRWWHPDFPVGQREVVVPESGAVTADVSY